MDMNFPYGRRLSAPGLIPGRFVASVPGSAALAPQSSVETAQATVQVMPQEVFEEVKPFYKNPYIMVPAVLGTVGLIALAVRAGRKRRK